jgi:hypothetical protein
MLGLCYNDFLGPVGHLVSVQNGKIIAMQKPRQVPGIGHLRQEFSRSSPPPIQSPLGMPQPMQQASDPVEELAAEIYCRLAVDLITGGGQLSELERLAASARFAAKVFGERS